MAPNLKRAVAQAMLWLQADGHVFIAGKDVVVRLQTEGYEVDLAAVLRVIHALESERCLDYVVTFMVDQDVAINVLYPRLAHYL